MKQIKTPDGIVHAFPDDATDQEISAALNGAPTAAKGPLRSGYHPPRTGNLDWIDRNIGQPLGLVQVDPVTGQADMPQGYKTGMFRTGATGISKGMTLGLADEAAALGSATGDVLKGKDFGQGYDTAIDKVRADMAAQHESHPVLDTAATLAGGLASGGPGQAGQKVLIAAPTAPQSLWQAIKAGAGYGAGYGGVSGFGSSEGGVGSRLRGTAWAGAKPELLADLGGNNLKQLARTAISVPGEPADKAATLLYERNAGAGDRVVLDLAKSGMPNEGYYNSLDDLIKTRSENAGPLYDEAYRAAGETWSPELARLEKRPSMAAAWNRAKMLAAEQGRMLPDVFQENAMQGLDNVPGKMPTLEAWDYMKQGLDDMLEKYRDPTTGVLHLDKYGRALNETRKQLLRSLDAAVTQKVGSPVYATARNQWAGPSEAMDALQAGRDVFKSDMEPTAKMIAGMTDTEKQFYRIGVVRAIKDRVDRTKDAGSVLKQFWNSPGWRDKLSATFPDAQSFEQFRTLMDREGNLFRTYSVGTQGSRTASVEAGQKELEQLSFLGDIFSGNFRSAAGKAMRQAQGVNSAVSDELGKVLFGPVEPSIANISVQRDALLRQQANRAAMLQRGLVPAYAGAGRIGGAMSSNQGQ